MSKILVSGGLVPTTKDTLLDARTRVATFSDIANIENPARFMAITVEDTGKKYEVKKLSSKIIGGIVVENSTIDINDPEALVDLGLAEELRSEDEKVRQSNESKRIEAENLRKSAEDSRKSNENSRISSENTRVESERTRVSSEETRNANEQTRNSNESKRQSQESTRQSQESARQSHESARQFNESTRNVNESARKESESGRKAEETSRRTAELSRSTAENTRVKNEQNRTTAENTRSSAEDRRVTNETQRTTNETARNSAELSREQAEGNRASTFNTLKGQMQTTIQEGQAAVAATEKATSDAQKVVDNYDAKVAEQDGKLSELGSEVIKNGLVTYTGIAAARTGGSFVVIEKSFCPKGATIELIVSGSAVTRDFIICGEGGTDNIIKNYAEMDTPYEVVLDRDINQIMLYLKNLSSEGDISATLHIKGLNDRINELENRIDSKDESASVNFDLVNFKKVTKSIAWNTPFKSITVLPNLHIVKGTKLELSVIGSAVSDTYRITNQNGTDSTLVTTNELNKINIVTLEEDLSELNLWSSSVSSVGDLGVSVRIIAQKNEQLEDIENEIAKTKELVDKQSAESKAVNSLQGVSFDSDVITPDNVKNAIKSVWFSCPTAGNIEKVLSNVNEVYISTINNKPAGYSPAIYISSEDKADLFLWFLKSQTEPRKGIETVQLTINSSFSSQFGLSGYSPLINIVIDWDVFGQDIREDSTGVKIELSKIWRFQRENVTVVESAKSAVANSLVGKTIVCFGDSLTEMTDTTNSLHYSDYISYMTGANVINCGVGGSQLRQRTTPSTTPRDNSQAYAALDIINMIGAACNKDCSMQTAANEYLITNASDDNSLAINNLKNIDWEKVDAVTIFAGTNDWYTSNTIGVSGSNDVNYTLGAINEIIRLVSSTYPHIKMFFFTPVVRWLDYSETNGEGTSAKWSDEYEVSGNGTLKQEAAAIMNEVALNHIPVCDMYNTLGWNKYNFKNYFQGSDGTHPRKEAGVMMLAKKILSFIMANNTL